MSRAELVVSPGSYLLYLDSNNTLAPVCGGPGLPC
jgi:hypothetical protein